MTAVTFQVNLGIQQALGNFDPAAHTVEAHGSFDGWGPGITLAVSAANTNVYQGTVEITGSAGAMIEHKFVINQAGSLLWEGNVGMGGAFGNRVFALADTNQTLPVVFFNNLTNNPGAGILVTFQVSMEVQTARGAFDPMNGTVDVRGPFNNWGTPSGFVLTNSAGNPYLYVGSLPITTTSPGGLVAFKFNMNGTWETGVDRTFTLASSSQTLPVEYFDRLPNLGPLSITPLLGPFEIELTLAWTGGPRVRLQSRNNLMQDQWQDVPDTAGQNSKVFVIGIGDEQATNTFFRLVGP